MPMRHRIKKKKPEKSGAAVRAFEAKRGDVKKGDVKITATSFTREGIEVLKAASAEQCFPYKGRPGVVWVNVDGLHQPEAIEALGTCFGIHPLTVEDILNTTQRPKTDIFDDYIFITLKMHEITDSGGVLIEQVSIVFGENFVLTFQEKAGDIFEPVRERLRSNKGMLRHEGADYLAYSLLDCVVDNYFKVVESLDGAIDEIETGLVENPGPETLQKIHSMRRTILYMLKSIWPLRAVVNTLEQSEGRLVRKSTVIYLRDLYDHTIQVIDTVETFRDMLSGMMDIYLSTVSNRLNEIIKFLTVVGTIFIPLTFITSLYRMNFRHMPELSWRWGYSGVLGLMLAVAAVMLAYFRKKNWL